MQQAAPLLSSRPSLPFFFLNLLCTEKFGDGLDFDNGNSDSFMLFALRTVLQIERIVVEEKRNPVISCVWMSVC